MSKPVDEPFLATAIRQRDAFRGASIMLVRLCQIRAEFNALETRYSSTLSMEDVVGSGDLAGNAWLAVQRCPWTRDELRALHAEEAVLVKQLSEAGYEVDELPRG